MNTSKYLGKTLIKYLPNIVESNLYKTKIQNNKIFLTCNICDTSIKNKNTLNILFGNRINNNKKFLVYNMSNNSINNKNINNKRKGISIDNVLAGSIFLIILYRYVLSRYVVI